MEGELYNYAAMADTIKIEDITSNEQNQMILRQLKENDPDLEVIYIFDESFDPDEAENTHDYIHINGDDIGWLGYYVGQSTNLHELHLCYGNDDFKNFYREMRSNTSIQKIYFNGGCCVMNPVEEQMALFFQNNHKLTTIHMVDCRMKAEGARQLAIAIGGCSKSLKQMSLIDTEWYEEDGSPGDIHLVNVITAIGNHTQLEELNLKNNSIGREEIPALATTVSCINNLQKLNLFMNDIDDEGIETLVDSLSDGSNLRELNLAANHRITIDGWIDVTTLLEMFDSKLEKLDVSLNYIGDGGAYIFSTALGINSTLKTLGLQSNRITRRGWKLLSKLLCDTSSVNNTYLSNHTLFDLTSEESFLQGPIPTITPDVHCYLALNRSTGDKGKVAIAKILLHHSHFEVQPFFEWELKVLPLMIGWFTRAVTFIFTYTIGETAYGICPEKINSMKLSVIYDFIKEFPMLYIEPVTRKEIAECTALEKELMNQSPGDNEASLEEIRRHKARAMRRLH